MKDYLRDPMKSPQTQCFIHFSVYNFFSCRIMLYHIILYKTTGILYYILGVMERREGRKYVCV